MRRPCFPAAHALRPHNRPPCPLQTAIMAAAELYLSYGDALLPHTDVGGQAKPLTSLLAQLLLKCGSGDKKFVVDEAQRALGVLGDSLAPAALLPLLLPYAEAHKNPKVRGKAGGAVAAAAARLDAAGVAAFGLPRLLQAASKLVTGACGWVGGGGWCCVRQQLGVLQLLHPLMLPAPLAPTPPPSSLPLSPTPRRRVQTTRPTRGTAPSAS